MLMRDALSYSLNIPTIRALDRIGVDNVANLAHELGITFARGDNQLQAGALPGAIGTAETNMVQLTSAYAAHRQRRGAGAAAHDPRDHSTQRQHRAQPTA